MKILVVHGGYGCETGCCGHWFEAKNDDGSDAEMPKRKDGWRDFTFGHPYSDKTEYRSWAEGELRHGYGEEHIKDLDWDNCIIVDD